MTIPVHEAVLLPAAALHKAPWNANVVPPEMLAKVRASLERYGGVENQVVRPAWCVGARSAEELEARRAAVIGEVEAYEVLSGNHRLDIYKEAEVDRLPCVVLELSDSEARLLAQALNRTRGEKDDPERRLELLRVVVEAIPMSDVSSLLPDRSLSDFLAPPPGAPGAPAEPPAPELEPEAPPPPAMPLSSRGELYELGPHRLMCGDCTDEGAVARLLDGATVTAVVTDPPYCSGGFNEATRMRGSVGTDVTSIRRVARDCLSTRGYTRLMQACLRLANAAIVYVFTDWRMWTTLQDLVEGEGLGVRMMVVWDKGSPALGKGWRCQHELILCAAHRMDVFKDQDAALGNVRRYARTGNKHHTTEKPVPLIRDLLQPVPGEGTIYDPFAGSGTTALAAGARPVCLMELDPAYCDVIRKRWGEWARSQGLEPGSGAL